MFKKLMSAICSLVCDKPAPLTKEEQCRRDFAAMDQDAQDLLTLLGYDPDSLKARGALDEPQIR